MVGSRGLLCRDPTAPCIASHPPPPPPRLPPSPPLVMNLVCWSRGAAFHATFQQKGAVSL